MSEIHVNAQVFKKHKPDLKVFHKDGSEVIVSEMIFSPEGEIVSVIDTDGTEFYREGLEICQNFLEVPGVGFLRPGSVVRIKGQEYVLNFGEHTNISNQTLISWFLSPCGGIESVPDPLGRNTSEDRTLYMGMVDEIDLVTI